MNLKLLFSLILIALSIVGAFLPIVLMRLVKRGRVQGWIALVTLAGMAGLITGLALLFFPGTDAGVIFTRAFLIDGIAFYALTHTTISKEEKV